MALQITAFPLRPSRVHEVCGPLAAGFAVAAAADAGQVMWIHEGWRPDTIGPAGLASYLDPARLLVALTRGQIETLAVAEEALRDGSVGIVIIELSAPIGLTAGRRLQLAAKAGQTTGLCLIGEGMGSPAVETRWRCRPLPDPDPPEGDSTLQHWKLIKNKSGTTGAWHVRWSWSASRLIMVSPAGE